VASRANSVSLAGSTSAPTRAQWTLPAVNRPASKYAEHHQHAVEASAGRLAAHGVQRAYLAMT
jgi:hypothetical protein